MKNSSPYGIWRKLKTPNPNNHNLSRFCYSNLFILKDENQKFGIVLSNTIREVKIYENIEVTFYKNLISGNKSLDNCLLIKNKFIDDTELFAKALDTVFSNYKDKNKFTSREIYNLINEVRYVFSRKKIDLNEIIGVWGELYLINILTDENSSKHDMLEIISGWESDKGRAVIDFSFKQNLKKIEVKTTTKDIRYHHINTLDQVSCDIPWTGFLASLCIREEKDGKSCYGLLKKIEAKLDEPTMIKFINKIEIRGKDICNDKTHKFILSKEISFFKFKDIPKPKVEVSEITNVEWDINLENTSAEKTNTIINFT